MKLACIFLSVILIQILQIQAGCPFAWVSDKLSDLSLQAQQKSNSIQIKSPEKLDYEIICPNNLVFINGNCKKNDLSDLQSKNKYQQNIDLQWEISGDGEFITIKQTVQNTSWQGIAFLNSDINQNHFQNIVYSKIIKNGESNSYILQLQEGILDEKERILSKFNSEIELLGYEITSESTTIKFKRKMNPTQKSLFQLKYGSLQKLNTIFSLKNNANFEINDIQAENQQIVLLNGVQEKIVCIDGYIIVDRECAPNDLSPLSSHVQIHSDVYLEWEISEDRQYIYVMQIVENFSWQGVAFGTGMTHSDVVYTQLVPNGDEYMIKITEGLCLDNQPPEPNQDQNTVKLLGYHIEPNKTIFKFKRKLVPDSNYGLHNLTAGNLQSMNSVFSHSNGLSMDYHGDNRHTFSIKLDNGVTKKTQVGFSKVFMDWHKDVFYVSWGFLIDISLILVRNFKQFKYAMYAHGIIQLFIDTATLIMGCLSLYYNRQFLLMLPGGFFTNLHYFGSVLLLFTIVFNHISGILVQYSVIWPKKGKVDRKAWLSKYHRIVGDFLYFLSKICVFTGFYWVNKSLENYIVLIYSIVMRGGFEILHQRIPNWYMHIQKFSTKKLQKNPKNRDILELVLQGKSHKQILRAHPNLKYVIAHNKLIDISKLQHPGGNYLTEACNGRDIDCFLFGGYALESSNRNQHVHSKQTQIWLDNHTLGSVYDPETDILYNQNLFATSEASESVEIKLIDNYKNYDNPFFEAQIANFEKLTKTTSRFDFEITYNQQNILPKNNLYGVAWMGKHFNLRVKGQDKMRCYTIIQSLSPKSVNERQEILDLYNNDFVTNESSQKVKNEIKNQYLPLVIKHYEGNNTLSSKIFELNKDLDYEIQGPMGLGLRIREQSNGHYLLFAGGTGILPFLDLIDFLLQKSIFLVAVQKLGLQQARKLVDKTNKGIETCLQNFKLSIYATFNSADDFVGSEILIPLSQINQKYNLNICDITLRFSNGDQIPGVKCITERFNEKLFKQDLEHLSNISRAWVCGPPAFQNQIPKDLQRYVDKEDIDFL